MGCGIAMNLLSLPYIYKTILFITPEINLRKSNMIMELNSAFRLLTLFLNLQSLNSLNVTALIDATGTKP